MESQFDEIHQPLLSTHDQSSPPPELNSSLEEVLSNTQLPLLKRFLTASWIELDLLFPLAGPAILNYLISNLMSVITRAIAGHIGNLQLAAANLGNSGVQLFAYGLMVMFFYH
jgi:MATE family multidrug resistance protein